MYLTCDRAALTAAVNHARKVKFLKESRVLIRTGADQVVIEATDGMHWLYQAIPAKVEEEGGAVVDGEMLYRAAKALVASTFATIQTVEEKIRVSADSVKADLRQGAPEEFPPRHEAMGETVSRFVIEDVATLKGALSTASPETHRYGLNQVVCENEEEGPRLASTDGSLLSIQPIAAAEGPSIGIRYDFAVIAAHFKAGVEVVSDGEQARIRIGERVWVQGPLCDEDFVEYRKVIPDRVSAEIKVDQERLLAALSACAGFVGANKATVLQAVNESLVLSCTNDTDRLREEVSCTGYWPRIGVQAAYLKTVAALASDPVVMRQSGDAVSPIILPLPDGGMGIVMPMRLD